MIAALVICWECEHQNITFPDSLKYSLEGQQDGTSGYETDIVYFLPTFLRPHALTSAISHLENNTETLSSGYYSYVTSDFHIICH